MRLQPFSLDGTFVRLEPLSLDHADDLVAAANQDRSTYGFTQVPRDRATAVAYIESLHAERDKDAGVPFVQRRTDTGAIVGCTRYLNVTWWSDRDLPVEVEVGGTWLAAEAQRTAVNTEAKLLLLGHAFETWNVHRVAICTASNNERSRRAIERLGAAFEGVLRNHRALIGDLVERPGQPRDTAVYSILDREWPEIRARLQERLSAG